MLTTLLYGAESWVTYRRHLRLIERYHQRFLGTVLNTHWSDFVTNIEVLEMANVTSIEVMLFKTHHRWAGHVSRMVDHRLPKIVLYGELAAVQRSAISDRFHQPSACLHQTRTSSLTNLRSQSRATDDFIIKTCPSSNDLE